jgi:methionyl-tRNA formyltransferase
MRVIFMGSPEFSVPALRALHGRHEVVCVYAQPPKPANRGQRETPCPVHQAALELGLPVRTPARVRRDAAEHAAFAALAADVAVVAAYGLILPLAMLEAPRLGCLNIHASLLPRWRGAAPIHAAVLAGDAQSGITIMRMEEGLDTGPMLLREAMPLHPRITTPELHDALSAMGSRLILRALEELPPPIAQPEHGATYAGKLSKADGLLDFSQPAEALERRVRAMNPWPGAYFPLGAENIRVLDAMAEAGSAAPGVQMAPGLIACGEGALRLLRLQRPGRAAMPAADFLRGTALPEQL